MTATRKPSTSPRAAPPAEDAPAAPPWGDRDPMRDPIHHTLAELARRVPTVPVSLLGEVDGVVRHYWARTRPSISAQPDLRARDEAIRRDHQRGERTGLLARRYQLTPERIRQILAEGR